MLNVNRVFQAGIAGTAALFLAVGVAPVASGDAGGALRALTGARTRAVWIQNRGDAARYPGDEDQELALMGLDTDDGLGEREILSKKGNYIKPLLTPSGERVVYSSPVAGKVYVVGFDGSGQRELAEGSAEDTWEDPTTGAEWVYMAQSAGKNYRHGYERLVRIRLDDPGPPEVMWDRTRVSLSAVQVSRDGTRASGLLTHPHMGVMELPNAKWVERGRGCWSSLAPDNSYLSWVFDGPHRNVTMFHPKSNDGWLVNINNAPGIGGFEVYHPRWTNHVRFMTMTGPYRHGERQNRIRGGGLGVEIYVGRFSETFTEIDHWAKATDNDRADFYPDVWIEGGEQAQAGPLAVTADESGEAPRTSWPGSATGLIFLWQNRSGANEVFDPTRGFENCRVEAKGRAKFDRFLAMDLTGGAFLAEDRSESLLEACRETGRLTIEAVITPDTLDQGGPARIVTLSSSASSRNFTLGQQEDALILRLRTPMSGENGSPPQPELCKVEAGRPQHVIVTYTPGMTVCYLDGTPVFASPDLRGDFQNWSAHHLLFGDEYDGGRDWAGRLEYVAIYSRAMGSDEARRHYELYAEAVKEREPIAGLAIRGKCVEVSVVPDPSAIAPYRRALAVHQYRVGEVIEGTFAEDEVLAARWVIMDGTVLDDAGMDVGRDVTLQLEPFEEHPELEGERVVMETSGLDLPLFYEISW